MFVVYFIQYQLPTPISHDEKCFLEEFSIEFLHRKYTTMMLRFNIFVSDYIANKRPLGGLLLLLPQKISDKLGGEQKNDDSGLVKKILVELEQLLIHAEIPVSSKHLSNSTCMFDDLPFWSSYTVLFESFLWFQLLFYMFHYFVMVFY